MAAERISFQDGSITLSLSINRESRDHVLRVQCGGNTAALGAQDALNLLQWLLVLAVCEFLCHKEWVMLKADK